MRVLTPDFPGAASSTLLATLVAGLLVAGCSSKAATPGGTGGHAAGSAGSGGSGASGATGGMGGTSGGGYKACAESERIGRFTLELKLPAGDSPGISQITGRVLDGIDPRSVWQELASAEGCQVIIGPTSTCAVACPSGMVCRAGTCAPEPASHGVGTVNVTGLAIPVTMMPLTNKSYYGPIPSGTSFPPFTPGLPIGLQAAGGDYAPFTLTATGIDLLDVPADQPLMLVTKTPNPPLTVRWSAPTRAGSTRMELLMDIAHHGGVAAKLACDLPDTGSGTIPGGLLDTLVGRGTAGFPEITLTRQSVDSTTITPGCVEFGVTLSVAVPLMVDGVISCSDDTQCPATAPTCSGQKCI